MVNVRKIAVGLKGDRFVSQRCAEVSTATVERVVDLALGPPSTEANPLDRPDAGEGGGGEIPVGAAIIEAQQLAHIAFERSEVRRETQGHCWLLRRSARPCVVLSVDEKSQIQALDPPSQADGRAGAMTYIQTQPHQHAIRRSQGFIRFLNAIEAQVPERKAIHAIVDKCATQCGKQALATLLTSWRICKPFPRQNARREALPISRKEIGSSFEGCEEVRTFIPYWRLVKACSGKRECLAI